MLRNGQDSGMEDWRDRTERLIAACQLAFALLIAALYFSAPRPIDGVRPESTVAGVALIVYLGVALGGLAIYRKNRWTVAVGWARLVLDFLLLSVVIASYPSQYGDNPEAALKAPTFVYYTILISLHAMRFSAPHILTAGVLSIAGWVTIVVMLLGDAHITRSYLDYATGTGVLLGAEIEKSISIAILTGLLMIAGYRARAAIRYSVAAQLREAQAETEIEIFKANSISQAKSDFLSKISHELRTPMNGVCAVADDLSRAALGGGLDEKVKILNLSATNLLTVIDNILDVTAIENNDLIIAQEPFTLAPLLNGVVASLRDAASAKGLELFLETAEDETAMLGDPRRLETVCAQLIGNAIKFTESGHVRVRATSQRDGDGAVVKIAVSDTGPGVAPEKRETIFKLFEQGDNSKTRGRDGCGLGLSIAKAFIEKMGGRLHFESIPRRGSTFSIELRLPVCEPAAAVAAAPDPAPCGARARDERACLRILIAEDNAVNQMVMKSLLAGPSREIIVAEDGEKAVVAFERDHPDLVFMDISMPHLDGIAATKKIRALEKSQDVGAQTPILAVTAHISDEMRAQCRAAGMDDYLTKPVTRQVIDAAIAEHLNGRRASAA